MSCENTKKNIGLPVILFCLFNSRIQAASQSKNGLYFQNFGYFYPNLRILFGFIPNSKGSGCIPKKAIKLLLTIHNTWVKVFRIIPRAVIVIDNIDV